MSELDPIATEIVFADADGEPFTTSLVIAYETGNQHESVVRVIRDNLVDLQEFGRVRFQIGPLQTAGGVQQGNWAVLTEPQSALLITFLRNNEKVIDFKKRLVRGFYAMRQLLAERAAPVELPGPRELAQMVIAAEDAREVAEKQLEIEAKARRAMESYAKDLEPRAEFYDRFMDGDGTYAVGVAAKMLGTGQNKLFAELRNVGVLISKGALRNTPYQQYMHHFDVKAYEFTREDGTTGTSYKTRVQPSGVEFIARKVGRTVQVVST